jgi:hypothetical protein
LDGPPEATANQLTTKLLQTVGGTIDKEGSFWIKQCEKLRDPRYVEETIRTAKSKKRQMKQISIERITVTAPNAEEFHRNTAGLLKGKGSAPSGSGSKS